MRQLLLAALLSSLLSLPAAAGEAERAAAMQALEHPDATLIDVRTPEEFADGALPGALNIETADLAAQIAEVAPDKDAPVVLYCRTGRRAGEAQQLLESLGYRQVINAGGYSELAPLVDAD
ncbi:rhodanese-like domain-containing protein [Pseudomonas oligotrophica]|uniref:rhodanese-like domain-containing protein n=1 Tax=Pseudomonas oligotrophica TaxID=2912055 RepID=UPI001F36B6D0|nr:rhodanese-like domain-containing protein [Pseudomonas oligotrophica]MCF7202830.1 rhodanese-like domain-containing protein [Pseudomonas oligotrophica]